MNKVNGFLYGLLSSASFGLIPLFTIPAMQQGMGFWSILLYRFLFAMLALAGILLLDKQSFRIRRKEILPLLLLACVVLPPTRPLSNNRSKSLLTTSGE